MKVDSRSGRGQAMGTTCSRGCEADVEVRGVKGGILGQSGSHAELLKSLISDSADVTTTE